MGLRHSLSILAFMTGCNAGSLDFEPSNGYDSWATTAQSSPVDSGKVSSTTAAESEGIALTSLLNSDGPSMNLLNAYRGGPSSDGSFEILFYGTKVYDERSRIFYRLVYYYPSYNQSVLGTGIDFRSPLKIPANMCAAFFTYRKSLESRSISGGNSYGIELIHVTQTAGCPGVYTSNRDTMVESGSTFTLPSVLNNHTNERIGFALMARGSGDWTRPGSGQRPPLQFLAEEGLIRLEKEFYLLGTDGPAGRLVLWSLEDGASNYKRIAQLDGAFDRTAAALSNGSQIYVASDRGVWKFDPLTASWALMPGSETMTIASGETLSSLTYINYGDEITRIALVDSGSETTELRSWAVGQSGLTPHQGLKLPKGSRLLWAKVLSGRNIALMKLPSGKARFVILGTDHMWNDFPLPVNIAPEDILCAAESIRSNFLLVRDPSQFPGESDSLMSIKVYARELPNGQFESSSGLLLPNGSVDHCKYASGGIEYTSSASPFGPRGQASYVKVDAAADMLYPFVSLPGREVPRGTDLILSGSLSGSVSSKGGIFEGCTVSAIGSANAGECSNVWNLRALP